jgi:hypothetical protein
MPWDIRGPGSGSAGGQLDKAEHVHHLQICVGAESRPDTPTRFGTSDAALCRYWVCVEDDLVVRDYLLFGQALVPRVLEAGDGDPNAIVCGRLDRAQPKAGQSAAWILTFPDESDIELASKWLDAHAGRMPSGRIEIEELAPSATDSEPF